MEKSRNELDDQLDELERDLAMLVLNDADHDDLWQAFAGQADAIAASAGPADKAHVRSRMDAILRAHGILAEGEAAD